jgi:arginase
MRKFMVISGSYGLGAGIRHPSRGPQVLRDMGLIERLQSLGCEVLDGGDELEPSAASGPGPDAKLRYLDQLLEFSARFGKRIDSAWSGGYTPIILGGDHSISITSFSHASRAIKLKHGQDAELGLLWIDAHGDLNTPETTPSGNIHGMSVATLLGHGDPRLCSIAGEGPKLRAENLAFIGARLLDPGEKDFIKRHQISCYTMKDIDYLGIGEVCRRAFDKVSRNTKGFIVSFDLDSCDPSFAPAVGTPVRAGLTFREAHLIMEIAAEHSKFAGVELIEYAPARDIQGMTSELGIALLESAAGKSIL